MLLLRSLQFALISALRVRLMNYQGCVEHGCGPVCGIPQGGLRRPHCLLLRDGCVSGLTPSAFHRAIPPVRRWLCWESPSRCCACLACAPRTHASRCARIHTMLQSSTALPHAAVGRVASWAFLASTHVPRLSTQSCPCLGQPWLFTHTTSRASAAGRTMNVLACNRARNLSYALGALSGKRHLTP